MADRDLDQEPVREFRLEGVGLVMIGVAMLAAFAGAFYFGRWYERRSLPPAVAVADEADPLAEVVGTEQPAAAESDLSFFDTLSGEGKQAEPRREVETEPQRAEPAAATPPPPAAAPAPAQAEAPAAGWYVQVFAGRSRDSAVEIQRRLQTRGLAVRVDSEGDGTGKLYKVRVGSYTDRTAATAAADELKGAGFPSAWPVEVK